MLTRISNLRSISADSSVSSNDVRKIIFPTGSLTNNGSGTITLTFSGDGSSFTNLNAGNLASGTLADARLSSNIPLKNAANTFTNANTIAVSSPAMVNLILQGAASQASDLIQLQNSSGTVLSSFDKSGNLGLGVSGSLLGRLHIKGIVQTMYVGDNSNTSAVYAQFQNLGGRFYIGVDNNTGTALWTGGIAYASSFGSANGTSLQLATNNIVRITINQFGNVLVNGFGSSVIGMIVKGAASQTADLFQTQDSSGNILNSFTASGQQSFYGLSSTTNRQQGFIKSSWKTSTDATRQGQINIGTIAIVSAVETMWTGYSQYTYTFGGGVNRLFGETDIMAESYGQLQTDANRPFARWEQYRSAPTGIGLSCYNRDTVAFSYQVMTINLNGFGLGTGNASDSVGTGSAIGFTTTKTFIDTLGNKLYFGQNNSDGNNLLNLSNVSATGAADTFTFTAQHVADATQANTPALNFNARQFSFTTGTANGVPGYLALSIGYSGTSPTIGFFGKAAILQPTASLVTTGYTAGASTTMTIDGKSTGGVGSTAYTFGDLIAILKNLGLLAS